MSACGPVARQRPSVVLVGGCHRDLIARTHAAFEAGTSCPGRIVERPGGVARNVAVLVASAGCSTTLVTRVGDDAAGRMLLAGLERAGVDGQLTVDPTARTGTYLAVHDRSGEMVAAVSDLTIYDGITPQDLEPHAASLADADLVFADANLAEATIAALAAAQGSRLAVDAISRAKADRVRPALAAGALLFINRTTAEVLTGRKHASPAEAAAAIRDVGARRAVVTGGASPVAVLECGAIREVPVPPTPVFDVTGAGDALTGASLAALAHGRSLPEAVSIGIRAAGAALGGTGALDMLPTAVVDAILSDQPRRPAP